MRVFESYLERIKDKERRGTLERVLRWVAEKFENLEPGIAWNQPMFTEHGTFIIGFSAARRHFAIAPERAGIERFADEIVREGYEHTKQLMRIRWTQEIDYGLLERMIKFNIEEKADCANFWRNEPGRDD